MAVVEAKRAAVQAVTAVPEELAHEFLGIYRSAVLPLDRLTPARQSLTDDEFMHEMREERVLKFVCRDASDMTVALGFMATDLSAVPWINSAYYEARFPDHYQRGAIYYFGALLVRPGRQGGPWATVILSEMSKRVMDDRAIVAFDCCAYNVRVLRLPELIATVGQRLGRVETLELEPQRHFAYLFLDL
jgi:hypothetical protein